MERSFELFEARHLGKFSDRQLARPITPSDCHEAHSLFGISVAVQMARDLPLYVFWDSASMIEQGWANFESSKPVEQWIEWVLEKLEEV